MNKVVINENYGGFSLSRKAVLLGRELSGDSFWGGACLKGDTYGDGFVVEHDYCPCDHIKRHDPILVQIVETLRGEASGRRARLKVKEIEGDVYRIDEYDGYENVVTPEMVQHEWIRI